MNESKPRTAGRSILAIVAGILAGIALTVVTDAVLHQIGFFPPLGQWTPSPPLLVATAYRIIYAILGSYIVARLAPNRPLLHALISGMIGVIASAAGAIATWDRDLGPHWYPIALVITALPCAWVAASSGSCRCSCGSLLQGLLVREGQPGLRSAPAACAFIVLLRS